MLPDRKSRINKWRIRTTVFQRDRSLTVGKETVSGTESPDA
jgi:hypothetical protein